MQGLD